MVRDTERACGISRRRRTAARRPEDTKRGHLFGVGGVFYDSSFDYPLPLLGVYYVNLDLFKRHEQMQVFFGGVLLAGSYNQPHLFGTAIDAGIDVFGIAIRGSDALFVNGTEDKTQRVKSRSFAGSFNAGVPLGRHVKVSATPRRDASRFRSRRHRDVARVRHSPPTTGSRASRGEPFGIFGDGRSPDGMRGTSARAGTRGATPETRTTPRTRTSTVRIPSSSPRTFTSRASSAFRHPSRILGSDNTDRFSKYSFGFFGGTALRGFRSGSAPGRGGRGLRAFAYIRLRRCPPRRGHLRRRPRQGPCGRARLGLLQRSGPLGRGAWSVVDAGSSLRGHAGLGPGIAARRAPS